MRYKEYNPNTVLEKSINLFWNKGFKACSINDIVEETGVNRFSLYHEFKDKDGILYESLKLYKERYFNPKLDLLNQKGDFVTVLNDFLLSFLKEENKNQGCYIIHIGTELADTNEAIKQLVKDFLEEISEAFINLLENNGKSHEHAVIYARQMVGLFCTSMSFCLIHNKSERTNHISKSINVIFKKQL